MAEEQKKLGKKPVFPPLATPEMLEMTADKKPDSSIAAPPTIASEALLAGRSEVHIRHRGEIYRLTLTRAGKLILHK